MQQQRGNQSAEDLRSMHRTGRSPMPPRHAIGEHFLLQWTTLLHLPLWCDGQRCFGLHHAHCSCAPQHAAAPRQRARHAIATLPCFRPQCCLLRSSRPVPGSPSHRLSSHNRSFSSSSSSSSLRSAPSATRDCLRCGQSGINQAQQNPQMRPVQAHASAVPLAYQHQQAEPAMLPPRKSTTALRSSGWPARPASERCVCPRARLPCGISPSVLAQLGCDVRAHNPACPQCALPICSSDQVYIYHLHPRYKVSFSSLQPPFLRCAV